MYYEKIEEIINNTSLSIDDKFEKSYRFVCDNQEIPEKIKKELLSKINKWYEEELEDKLYSDYE